MENKILGLTKKQWNLVILLTVLQSAAIIGTIYVINL